ncbi:MAG: arginine--tRNA ligase [Kiritimatiellae bacterium]|nr:arginine--tRNA ligase [Kiritimatiellia bacterium]
MAQALNDLLSEWIQTAFETVFSQDVEQIGRVTVVASARPEHGDYQCNDCMRLAKVLKQAPRQIAETFVSAVEKPDCVRALEVAGPGFINISLDDQWLAEWMASLADDERLGVPRQGEGTTIVMDYGSPNITKPLHIGHLRSHNIGSALDRVHRFLGYHVVADNHLGDWGTQFGITILGYRHFGDKQKMREYPLEELERVYVKSYEKTKEDSEWLDACRQELVKLQSGDPETLALWEDFTRWSIEELERVYARLNVSFDMVRGESHYRNKLKPIVERLEAEGLTRISEGATVVDLEEEKLPLAIVRKSDGGFNYATTDLATVASRIDEFSPERIIYITDERQQLHFKQVFAICRRLGITTRLDHVWFGLMRLPDATFSTREGNVIKLESLLDKAEELALNLVRESSSDMPSEQQQDVARAVGIGAVKYADLSQNPQSLVTFTWEKALALDGNSGPYLQYAYARIASVNDKYKVQFPETDPSAYPLQFTESIERALAIKILRFSESVILAADSYKPSALTDYLYELAQMYSTFYQNVPFLKAPEGVRESRVRLCGLVARVLKQGLDLLGLETPERI